MKKILLSILLILAFATNGFSADYFACAADEVHANNVWCTAAHANGSCSNDGTTEADTGAILSAGNSFYANGCAMTITSNVTVAKLSTAANGEVAGGGFTVSTNGVVIQANLEADTTTALFITGAGVAVTLGSSGTPITIQGGSAATAYGVYDQHTGVGSTTTVYATITGGTNITAKGYYSTSSSVGGVNIIGTCVGGTTAVGCQNKHATTGTMTVLNCYGAAAGIAQSGCYAVDGGKITVTGDIKNTDVATGVFGVIEYAPATASNFIWFTLGTDIYLSVPPAADKILTTGSFVNSTDGTVDSGTASAGGGGGAWGF